MAEEACSKKLSDKQICALAEIISLKNMEIIAIGYMD